MLNWLKRMAFLIFATAPNNLDRQYFQPVQLPETRLTAHIPHNSFPWKSIDVLFSLQLFTNRIQWVSADVIEHLPYDISRAVDDL